MSISRTIVRGHSGITRKIVRGVEGGEEGSDPEVSIEHELLWSDEELMQWSDGQNVLWSS